MISKRYEIPQTDASNILWYFSSSFNALDILYILCIAFVYFTKMDCFFRSLTSGAFQSRGQQNVLSPNSFASKIFRPSDMPFSKIFELAIGHWQRISSSGHRDYRDGNSTVRKRLRATPSKERRDEMTRNRETGLRKSAAKK